MGVTLGMVIGVALGCAEVDAVGVIVGDCVPVLGLEVGNTGGGANGHTLCSGCSFKSD